MINLVYTLNLNKRYSRWCFCITIYLYIGAEYLGPYIYFISNSKRSGIGIWIAKDGPNIPYLLYINPYLSVCRVTKQTVRNIKHILDHYCKVSTQLVNYHKSKVQFSKGISRAMIKEIIDVL